MNQGKYETRGSDIVYVHPAEEPQLRATCETSQAAENAVKLLNRARYLNDVKRQYTNAARAILLAELEPGFSWIED